MKIKHLFILSPCLLPFVSPSVFAADKKEEQITVSATRGYKAVSEMAQTTWVIDNAEIEQQAEGGKELKDILAQLIPGMSVSGQGRTNYGMNMRGRSMIVMVDGVRLNSSRSDSRQLDSIDPFNINHIEVISGATAMYGGGSSGGLINIVTKKGQEEKQVSLQLGGKTGFNNGKDHDENVAAAVSGGNENAHGRVAVAYQRYGGWYDGKGNAINIDNTQTGLQFSDRLDIMASGTINVDEKQQIQAVYQHYKSESDGKHGLYLGKDFSAVKGQSDAYNSGKLNSDRLPGTERNLLNLQYSNADVFGQDFVAQVYYRDESQKFYPFPTLKGKEVTSISSSDQQTNFYGTKLTFNSQPMDELTLTYGVDAEHEQFRANQMFFDLDKAKESGGMDLTKDFQIGRYPSYTTTNMATFLQSSYDISPMFTLSGGVRYQYTENKVDDFIGYSQQEAIANGNGKSADTVPGGKTDYNNLLFNAGVLVNLTEEQQTWFNFSQGFEIPDIAKYYGTGTYSSTPDANGHWNLKNSVNINDTKVKGIKVNSFELGWRYTGENLRTQIATYYSLSDRSYGINKDDMTIYMKTDKRRIYGVEGAVDYFFDDSDWSVGSNFNLQKSESKVNGSWEKWSVDFASPSKVNAYVGWEPNDWALRLQSQQTFNLTDAAGKKLDGYNTVDLLGSYMLPVGKVSFAVENLLDKNYSTIWGQRAQGLYSPKYGAPNLYDYKGRGRTFALNYSVTF
ncbi:TonB-dependent siderophore receptor [Providencia rettgeri]|uniref:TonB-dependent siderophore receptor n=1 Tax=Providencia TaxID=586 RepID=UPI0005B4F5B9|nr:TonB-dependent siderophore receptor [Providencia rettgeri]EJD6041771.1 TonB-dependent siderophore receptor [Providencia rettgeri]ELR5126203.1 TonB-dependent siderophore receptor [Providencia rettgeri]ELR5176633.1 TonB-dependent siderophore receptor [Providencia rettgeri]ELR5212574.1 TonB-dependent siderophore receptor [Providencia rettgeri]ELR5246691.1 TonB-dependent siderophore receptor [Providencia rettgeri]